MALYYNLVFGLLLVELVLFVILSLPLPSKIRRPLITSIAKPLLKKEFTIGVKCILVFILILFIDSVNRVNSINEELFHFNAASGDRLEIQARKFYAQRNMYLTGFTLFLTLIVSRTYKLVFELLNLKEQVRANAEKPDTDEIKSLKDEIRSKKDDLEILKKQAESLRKDYDELLESTK